MSSSLAQTAIAFLIDLAERGELDPWDVKVIEVIDRFLNSLKTQADSLAHQGRTAYEANLSESGQAFLYASMLVLLKADTMVRAEAEAEAEAIEEEALWVEDDLNLVPLPRNLERHLHRRAGGAPPQRRKVTLNELIHQLETMAAVMDEHIPRARVRRARPQAKRQAVRAIAQLAHQENLSEIAAALETFLDTYWDTLDADQLWLDFDTLIEAWPTFKPVELNHAHPFESDHAAAVHERVGVFWGLLFLSAQSKVELSQKEFYRDLNVRNLKKASLSLEEAGLETFVLPD
ncbi:MAG TPA: segregation/condensation protein A [Leptolyngbyaceae cyanobacterium M65_K2018_010]|nr:segregation/condensation protein A [Leptolyngbyaceae cyanobacterium M65_K2018_010]